MQKRFFRFSYLSAPKEDRILYPHQIRDGDACLELSGALSDLNYGYGGTIFNYPPDGSHDASQTLLTLLGSSDLLVLTTRPPLDDRIHKHKKVVIPSKSFFEQSVLFPVFRKYFDHCSRLEVCLTKTVAERLPAEYKNRAMLGFHTNATAAYSSSRSYGKCTDQVLWDEKTTAVYLVHSQDLWPGGPQLLATFGMGGTMGFVWAHLLGKSFPHLLDGPRFVMAEITRTSPIPDCPLSLDFSERWQVQIVVNVVAL